MAQWVRMLATQREDLDSDLQQPRKIPGRKGTGTRFTRASWLPSPLQFQREILLQRHMVESNIGDDVASVCVHIGSQVCTYNIYIHHSDMPHTCACMTSFLTLQILCELKYNYIIPSPPTLPMQARPTPLPLSNLLPLCL